MEKTLLFLEGKAGRKMGGVLVTDGGIAFYGSVNGDFRAVDRRNGKVLWHERLGAGIINTPITCKQLRVGLVVHRRLDDLPVAAGHDMNDKFGATARVMAAEVQKIPQGGPLYTFRVGD